MVWYHVRIYGNILALINGLIREFIVLSGVVAVGVESRRFQIFLKLWGVWVSKLFCGYFVGDAHPTRKMMSLRGASANAKGEGVIKKGSREKGKGQKGKSAEKGSPH